MSELIEKIVAVVAEPTIVGSVEQIRQLPEQISLIEWRLDYLNQAELLNETAITDAIGLFSQKVIVTLRSEGEGGKYRAKEASRNSLLSTLSKLENVVYVDVDITNQPLAKLIESGKLLMSYHNFKQTPENTQLAETVEAASTLNPAMIKLACRIQSDDDVKRLFDLFEKYPEQKLAIIPMSSSSDTLRLSALKKGSQLMFVSSGATVAPGQMSVGAMLEVIEKGV